MWTQLSSEETVTTGFVAEETFPSGFVPQPGRSGKSQSETPGASDSAGLLVVSVRSVLVVVYVYLFFYQNET